VTDEALFQLQPEIGQVLQKTTRKTGLAAIFLLGESTKGDHYRFLQDIEYTAADLQEKSDIIVSIGIGGSYLARRQPLKRSRGRLEYVKKMTFGGVCRTQHQFPVYAGFVESPGWQDLV